MLTYECYNYLITNQQCFNIICWLVLKLWRMVLINLKSLSLLENEMMYMHILKVCLPKHELFLAKGGTGEFSPEDIRVYLLKKLKS